ncbi:MAG: cupin domain-containing protein [Alphaproteobacteria bacterium]
MPIIRTTDVEDVPLHDDATYRTLVGDDEGSTPVRLGLQTSPPGFNTGVHWHPYMEIVIVLEGEGEAWIDGEGDIAPIGPGTTMVFPPTVKHWFGVTGVSSMKTYGIHASPDRVVERPQGEVRRG